MESRRKTSRPQSLCSGPGKLCRAFAIDKALYGTDLCRTGPLYLEEGDKPPKIASTKRIGIDYAVMTRDMPWRFTVADSEFLSRNA
jgi:DNA-3-methyladenine glycosylase